MTKECMIAWTIVTTDPEEMIATVEMLQEEAKERKKKEKKRQEKKDKSRKERKLMRNCAETLHVPRSWQSPIAKPWSTNITTKNTKGTSKTNANTTMSNSPTTTRIISRKENVTSASS